MRFKQLRTASLSYFLSIILGVFLMMIVLVAFLRFSAGNVFIALTLAFSATLFLSFFLAWVDVIEAPKKEPEAQGRFLSKRRGNV